MFERGGHAGMLFRYRGRDTGNRWTVVRSSALGKRPRRARADGHGFVERVYYFAQGGRCQNLNGRRPRMTRRVRAWFSIRNEELESIRLMGWVARVASAPP